ncbi:hypothetical protein GLOIN_2v1879451 [Rhizophagus irregularis DAOM 181602=DAOM 197198]|nr:hypothetical protein GLOIN_2v1879451 [Rhizophagus irregularis DAOM 181602=DAOM 197198]
MENIFNNKEIPIMRIRKRSEEREREEQQQIIEIIRHLVNNNNYIVHGYWLFFFWKRCEKCNKDDGTRKMNLITSFRLQCPSYNSKGNPTIEITRHLEWNNHYRVFGNWKCLNCQNRWSSAYTWVSLQKFIEQKHLVQGDFFMQNSKSLI